MPYQFGVSGEAVWSFHLAIGMFMIWTGYQITSNGMIEKWQGSAIMILGALAAAYHAHIWWLLRIK